MFGLGMLSKFSYPGCSLQSCFTLYTSAVFTGAALIKQEDSFNPLLKAVSKELDALRPVSHYGYIRAIYILSTHIKGSSLYSVMGRSLRTLVNGHLPDKKLWQVGGRLSNKHSIGATRVDTLQTTHRVQCYAYESV